MFTIGFMGTMIRAAVWPVIAANPGCSVSESSSQEQLVVS